MSLSRMLQRPKFRIIRVDLKGDCCHWQLQKRHYLFFWKDACGNVSSATTAAHEMERQMRLSQRDNVEGNVARRFMLTVPSKYSCLFAICVISFAMYGAWIQACIMSVFVLISWNDNN